MLDQKTVETFTTERLKKHLHTDIPFYEIERVDVGVTLDHVSQNFVLSMSYDVLKTEESKTFRKIFSKRVEEFNEGSVPIRFRDYLLCAIGLKRFAKMIAIKQTFILQNDLTYEVTEKHCPHVNIPGNNPIHLHYLAGK